MSKQLPILKVLVFSSLLYLAACANSGGTAPRPNDTAGAGEVTAVLAVSDLALDNTRLSFVLLGPEGREITHADSEVEFYRRTGPETAVFIGTAAAGYQEMAVEIPHVHEDGEVHGHREARGVYVVGAPFDSAGDWGAVIRVPQPGAGDPWTTALNFQVRERSLTPSLGDPAPASPTETASSVDDLAAICSRQPPGDMHQLSLDQAVHSGEPAVLVFASPSFCQTRICGPVTDMVLSLEKAYRGRLHFIHVEPYDLDLVRSEGKLELTSAAQDWRLPTEPWVFVVDSDGRIAAKFEGILGLSELGEAIDSVLPLPVQHP